MPPDRLAGQLRHPLGRGAGGEAARREEQDLARAPGLAEQGGRDGGGLAGAGRGDEDGVGPGAQGREQIRQDGVDGKAQKSTHSVPPGQSRSSAVSPIQTRAARIRTRPSEVEQQHRRIDEIGVERADRIEPALQRRAGA